MCDFTGLYPSALITNNVCLSTMEINANDDENYFIV